MSEPPLAPVGPPARRGPPRVMRTPQRPLLPVDYRDERLSVWRNQKNNPEGGPISVLGSFVWMIRS